MKAAFLPAALCLLAGCGAPFEFPKATCHTQGITWELEDGALDCPYYEGVLSDAMGVLSAHDIASEDAMRAALESSIVWARRDVWFFDCTIGGPPVDGCEYESLGVAGKDTLEVNREANALLHELMHVWEQKGLHVSRSDSAAHLHWDERGWTALYRAFLTKYAPAGPPPQPAGEVIHPRPVG